MAFEGISIVLAVILLLLSALLYLSTHNFYYWKKRGIPYEKSYPIVGSFYKILFKNQHISERIREVYNNFSDPYVGMLVFNRPHILIRSPELIKTILIRDFNKFSNRSITVDAKVDPIGSNVLFVVRNPIWKALRSKLTPVFTSGKIKSMLPLIRECGDNLLKHLHKRNFQSTDFKEIMSRYSIDVISSCAFGIEANCLLDDDSIIRKNARTLLNFRNLKRALSAFCIFFCPALVPIFRPTFLDTKSSSFFLDIFYDNLKQRKEKNITRHDVIELLNTLKTSDNIVENYVFDDQKMAAQAIMFFNAGSETTSSTLGFALYELALHKPVQERLRDEVKQVMNKYGGDATYEALQEMKYLDMVINETLRKYPITTFLSRECDEDYTFQETGFKLEKGVAIFIPVSGLHFDQNYFPNPHIFDPERFNETNKVNIKPCTYLPFGNGPRTCIGERFALLVVKVGLAGIIKNFEIQRSPETPVPLVLNSKSLFMEATNGIPLRIVEL